MISLIPAVAGRRTNVTMMQQISQATQERIDELIRRTQEKEEERKKKKRELQAGEVTTSSSGQECPTESAEGQETTMAMSEMGHTVSIEHTVMGDESERTRKQMMNQVKKRRKLILESRKKQQLNMVTNPLEAMLILVMNHLW